jgi:hypothetical protein
MTPVKELTTKLQAIFEGDAASKKIFLQYCLLFTISSSPGWDNLLQPLFNGSAFFYYKEDVKVSKE